MSEWFITANSFAAPFISDTSTHFIEASSAKEALEKFSKHINIQPGSIQQQSIKMLEYIIKEVILKHVGYVIKLKNLTDLQRSSVEDVLFRIMVLIKRVMV